MYKHTDKTVSEKLQTDWNGDFGTLSGLFQTPGLRVNPENHHVVRTLIGNQEEVPGRIDDEVSRPISFGRYVFDESRFACALVDGKDDDAVMSAVGAVQEFARGRDVDVSAVTDVRETGRQR